MAVKRKRTKPARSKRTRSTKPAFDWAPPEDILSHLCDVPGWDGWNALRSHRPKTRTVDGETFTFDAIAAERVVRFVEAFCRHYLGDLAGHLMILEPWQKWLIEELFGWKRANGTRRYRKAFIFIPRKNGKTQLIATILIYLMIADGEAGANCYAAAADTSQARMIFDAASMIIEQDETLKGLCLLYKQSFRYPKTRSSGYVLSSKPNTKHGLNAHGVLIDELHAHESRELYDVLMTSRGSRKRSLAVIITTAGVYDEQSICFHEYRYAKRVSVDPSVDPYLFPVLFEAPSGDDWRDEATWRKANPGLAGGDMIQLDYLREECRKAMEDPSYENTFRQLQLNQWIEQATRWLPVDRWKACESECPFPKPDHHGGDPLFGRTCFLGIDLSARLDLTAVVELYPYELDIRDDDNPETARPWGVWVVPRFWTPRYRLAQRETADNASYTQWAKDGHLTVVDEDVIPEGVIESHVRSLVDRRSVKEIVFDRWGMAGLGVRLQEEFGRDRVVQQAQGFHLSPAAKEFFGAVLTGRLRHPGNKVLDYCAANVAVKHDDLQNIKPMKSYSGGRIDGITALLTGLSRVLKNPIRDVVRKSVYDTQGIAFI